MSKTNNIPLYAADGRCLGFRDEEVARRLVGIASASSWTTGAAGRSGGWIAGTMTA